MFAPLNNVTTTDQPSTKNTIRCPGAVRFNLDIANAAVFVQFADGTVQLGWRDPVFVAPGFRSLDRRADAIRVWSAVAGRPAQVTVEVLTPREVS